MSFPVSVRLNDEDANRQTSDKRLPLGTLGVTRDGRKFRYTRNGAVALTVGSVIQSMAVGAATPQTTATVADNYWAVAPAATSSSVKVRFLSTKSMMGSTVNYWADGWIYIRAGTGVGQMLRILSHGAATTTATAGHVVNLAWDSRLTAAGATSTANRIGIMQNLYSRVVVSPAAASTAKTGKALGVAPRAVTASYYFWLQTGGLCAVKREGTVTRGIPVSPSTNTAGYIVKRLVATTWATAQMVRETIGHVVHAGSTAEGHSAVVYLTLD